MLNFTKKIKNLFIFIPFLCFGLHLSASETQQEDSKPLSNQEDKIEIVVAMPFRPNMPLDPHWYTPEYVDYIANLLPSEKYHVTGYFVSLKNIPQFLSDMEHLSNHKKNIRVLNFCDGGEWDGYPGISFTKEWEKHPISKQIPISGADSQFIFESDDKLKMNAYIRQANLQFLPQVLIPNQSLDDAALQDLLAKEKLDHSWPLFCKLNVGAGALGIGPDSICHNIAELKAQLHKMQNEYPNSSILVQPYLAGAEYTILVLKDKIYVAVQRDFHNSYNIMLEDYLTGIRDPKEEITYHAAPKEAQELAVKAIQAISGKHHYTRVDLRNDGKGNIYVIDINDRPGFGNPSTVKCMLDYHRLQESQLLLDIINTSSIQTKN